MLISHIFSCKYWMKIFPFEVFIITTGFFNGLFGNFNRNEFFDKVSTINLLVMITFIHLIIYVKRCILLKSLEVTSAYCSKKVDFKTLNLLEESILICSKTTTVFANDHFVKQFGNRDIMNDKMFWVYRNQILQKDKQTPISMRQLIQQGKLDEVYSYQLSINAEIRFILIKAKPMPDLEAHTFI